MNLEYYSHTESYAIKEEDFNLEEISHNPEIILDLENALKVSEEVAYATHRTNRKLIAERSNFLGVGNNGFVCSMGGAETGLVCLKFIWQKLEVIPGKELKVSQLSDFGEEILKLYDIKENFSFSKEVNGKILGENRNFLPSNEPVKEAAMQHFARQVLLKEGIECFVPRVKSIFKAEEKEEDYDPHSYYLNEKYTMISMEQVKGISIQDLIDKYPENKEYLERIDFSSFSEKLKLAIKNLNEKNFVHGDITIRNIMIDFDTMNPVLIDFGKSHLSYTNKKTDEKDLGDVLRFLQSLIDDPVKKKAEYMKEIKRRNLRAGYIFN